MSGRILPRVTRRKEEEGEFVPELVLAMRAMDKTNGRQSRSLHALGEGLCLGAGPAPLLEDPGAERPTGPERDEKLSQGRT